MKNNHQTKLGCCDNNIKDKKEKIIDILILKFKTDDLDQIINILEK